jgi:hypothetical protein
MDLAQASAAWDVEEMFAALYNDGEYVRASTALHVDLVRDFTPGVAADSFGLLTCLAARILKVPLVSVLQGNFHPASDGFLRWQGQRPVGLPSPAPIMTKVAAEYGIAPVARCADLPGRQPFADRRHPGNGSAAR